MRVVPERIGEDHANHIHAAAHELDQAERNRTGIRPFSVGVSFTDMLFLDDQMTNIRGAEEIGITSVWLDVSDPDTSYAEVRKLLGLSPEDHHG